MQFLTVLFIFLFSTVFPFSFAIFFLLIFPILFLAFFFGRFKSVVIVIVFIKFSYYLILNKNIFLKFGSQEFRLDLFFFCLYTRISSTHIYKEKEKKRKEMEAQRELVPPSPIVHPAGIVSEDFFQRIVLTGGPCGGKTTALSEVSERLRSLGLQVFIQPEISTLLSLSGAGFPASSGVEYRNAWEVERLKIQIEMEMCFARIAKASGRPTVLLCDRGTGDSAAYCDPGDWKVISTLAAAPFPELREDPETSLVNRYDLVIHLVTAADGAEAFYTKVGNSARRETPEEALVVDRRVNEAWARHPSRRVVDNSTDFAGKIRRVVTAICGHLGVLSPKSERRSYAVARHLFKPPKDLATEEFNMKYTFLYGSNESENWCIRERIHGESHSYSYSHKYPDGFVTERLISGREAIGYTSVCESDPAKGRCKSSLPQFMRKRLAFVTEFHYFELDDHDLDEMLLSVEVSEGEVVHIPDWLKPAITKEITDANDVSLYNLCLKIAAGQSLNKEDELTSFSL